MVNTKILELTNKLKKQFEEDSVEFSKKGCRSASYVNNRNMNPCNNSDYSSENSETSKVKTCNNVDEVSISLMVNDDNDKFYNQKDIDLKSDVCRMSANKPSKPPRQSTYKACSQNKFNSYRSTCNNSRENVDRSKYFRTLCAQKNLDFNCEIECNNFVSNFGHKSRIRRHHKRKKISSKTSEFFANKEVYDSDDAVNHFYRKSDNKSKSCYDSSEDRMSNSEYRSRLVNYKKVAASNFKLTKAKRFRIKQLLEVLAALREESPDESDSSDSLSFEKMELLNKLLKKKIKNLHKFSKDPYEFRFGSNNSPEPRYNTYGIVRDIPYRYSRPRLPPSYHAFDYEGEEKLPVKSHKSFKARSKSKNRKSEVAEFSEHTVSVYSKLPIVGDRPNKKNITKHLKMQQLHEQDHEINQPSIQVFYGLNNIRNDEMIDSKIKIQEDIKVDHMNSSNSNLETQLNSYDIESEKEELSKFPEDFPLNSDDISNTENQSSQDFIQQISRQMRITFFKEKPLVDETNYEANLPVLPPSANLNASDSKVNKPHLAKKRYSS